MKFELRKEEKEGNKAQASPHPWARW